MAYRSFSLSEFEARGVRKVNTNVAALKPGVRPRLVGLQTVLDCSAPATHPNCGKALKPSATKHPGPTRLWPLRDSGYGNNALGCTNG